MNHLIIDFETIGKTAIDCAIIDCSVMIFNFERFLTNPYTLDSISETKKFKVSVADQVNNYGWKVDKEVLQFWEEQEPDVRSKIAPKKSDLTVKEFVSQFHEFLILSPKIDYWWSRSNTFDPVILTRIFAAEGKLLHLEEYLKYWKVRDTRTYIDTKMNFKSTNGFIPITNESLWNKSFKKHDSSWDILADVLRFQQIYLAENDLDLL